MQITRSDYERKRAHGYAGTRAELINPDAGWMKDHTHWMLHNVQGATTLSAVDVIDDRSSDAYQQGYNAGQAATANRDPHTIVAGAVSIPSQHLGGTAATPDGFSAAANDYVRGYHQAITDARTAPAASFRTDSGWIHRDTGETCPDPFTCTKH